MGGVELRDDTLIVDREPNALDNLAVEFSSLLSARGIDHVFVAGYVVILTGRARSTQDIDVIVERTDEAVLDDIAAELGERGFWGPAMPLAEMPEMLPRGDNIWIARDGEMAPHLEVKFASDEFDRASLRDSVTARIRDATVPVGPMELQIAYKLYLGTQTDFEDALHLYTIFEESLRTDRLEDWVRRLGVEREYERLERA